MKQNNQKSTAQILYNVVILGVSIGITYNYNEAVSWWNESSSDRRFKEIRNMI